MRKIPNKKRPPKRLGIMMKKKNNLGRPTLLLKDLLDKFLPMISSKSESTLLLIFVVLCLRMLTPTLPSQATCTMTGPMPNLVTTPLLGREENHLRSLNLWKVSMNKTAVTSLLRNLEITE
jgi:hypothetical protein